jgi:ATP adenylyltransferase
MSHHARPDGPFSDKIRTKLEKQPDVSIIAGRGLMSTIVESYPPRIQHNTTCRFCVMTAHEKPVMGAPVGFAVPSIGAFVEGWLLVIPYRHMVALSDLEEWERKEYRILVEETEKLVRKKYGHTILFEHGPAGEGRNAGCGIDHAHLHIVPIELVLHEAVTSDGTGRNLQWHPAALPWDADAEHAAGLDYFFVRESDGTAWVAGTPAAPSQLLRRAIAKYVGSPVWDWKADSRQDLVAATYRRLLDSN